VEWSDAEKAKKIEVLEKKIADQPPTHTPPTDTGAESQGV
jgi:hypothetical protein